MGDEVMDVRGGAGAGGGMRGSSVGRDGGARAGSGRVSRALVLLAGLLPTWGLAAPPVIVSEAAVAQYRQAAGAAAAALPGARTMDVAQDGLAEALRQAPVIVAVGQQALGLARQHAPQVPLVLCMVLGVQRGTFSDTVTGIPLAPDPRSTLEAIRSVVPGARRVGVLYDPAVSELLVERAQAVAPGLGLTLVKEPVTPLQVREAVQRLAPRVDVLWLPPDPKLFSREVLSFLLSTTSERKLPVVGFLEGFTRAGAVASVSADFEGIGKRAGALAAEIVKRPADKRVPVPEPVFAPGRLSVNLKTAGALGIVPSSAALTSASDVVR